MHGPMRERIAAVISLVVVFPLLPPTATMGILNSPRHAWPSCCSARSASGTTICGTACSTTACSTMAPMAPRSAAAATNSRPSKFGPRSATNSDPGARVRLSVATAPYGRSSPANRPPSAVAASLNVRFIRPPPCSCGHPEITLRFAPIAETAPRLAVDLVILMALAPDQHDVLCASFVEGRADGRAAVVNDAHAAGLDALDDGAGDGLRIL